MFKFNYCYSACMSNQFACKIDLSNAFWHIGIHESCKRFLGFRFDNTNYVWRAMPFGLRTAPYLFSKLMLPIIKHLRKKYKITIFDYLDDLLILAPTEEIAIQHVNFVIETLINAGFSVNLEKSITSPVNNIVFLGVSIDLVNKSLVPSEENVNSCITKSRNFVKMDKALLVDFQSLIGSLNFSAPYIRFGRLNLSPIHYFHAAFEQNRVKRIPVELVDLLRFWNSASNYVAIPIPNLQGPKIVIASDASAQGWGAKVTWVSGSFNHYSRSWTERERNKHINIKELKAAINPILDNPSSFSNANIRIFSDNKCTVKWLTQGTTSLRSGEARDLLFKITALAYDFAFSISAVYVKGASNLVADSLSRSLAFNPELVLKQSSFDSLCSLLDFTPDIDLFANSCNHKCPAYCSASPDPKAVARDALKCS